MNTPKQDRSSLYILLIIIALPILGLAAYFLTAKPIASDSLQNTPDTLTTEASSTNPTSQGTTTHSGVSKIKNYYVAVGDAGKSGMKFGCDDSLVYVVKEIPSTQAPLRASLEALFADHNQFYGKTGLMNALYQSQLIVDSAVVANGVANIKITGAVTLGGICDDPRFVEQIKGTVTQFPSITSANITVNGKALASFLSEK